jgi:hypothetical protein
MLLTFWCQTTGIPTMQCDGSSHLNSSLLHITTSRLILAPKGYFICQNLENACAALCGQEIKGQKQKVK